MHDLRLKRYRPRRVQALNEDDPDRRIEYCETMLNLIDDDEALVDRLVFGDEAKFHMNGTVNRYDQVGWMSVQNSMLIMCITGLLGRREPARVC